jgi:hypothetical protein
MSFPRLVEESSIVMGQCVVLIVGRLRRAPERELRSTPYLSLTASHLDPGP